MDLGLLLSLCIAYHTAQVDRCSGKWAESSGGVFTPWAVLIILLFAVGVWILLQPMQMRGMMIRPG